MNDSLQILVSALRKTSRDFNKNSYNKPDIETILDRLADNIEIESESL